MQPILPAYFQIRYLQQQHISTLTKSFILHDQNDIEFHGQEGACMVDK